MATKKHGGSFRDPAGFIFSESGTVYRQINQVGKADYDTLMQSGLYEELVKRGLLVSHQEVKSTAAQKSAYKVIKPTAVPFISYPYEWTFSQLKDAALLTLSIQEIAMKYGMSLKDASAYNVQFIGNKPIFIDTLSFAVYEKGRPWEGYKQFCEHFIAPLALAHYSSQEVFKILRVNLDGIPLPMVCKLLPRRARFKSGLLAHLYLHKNAYEKYKHGGEEIGTKVSTRQISEFAMQGIQASLKKTVKRLTPARVETEWGEYYTFTNYNDAAFTHKRETVRTLLKSVAPKPVTVWDIGANNGEFSQVAAEEGAYTIAFDIDANAVAYNYAAKRSADIAGSMLPLVQDLTNPSSAVGWAHRERASLEQRGPADVVMALALIHHLAIGNNLPFENIAGFLKTIGKHVIIEFVPKEDSKVQHLLASRQDIFEEYDAEHFEAAMDKHFTLVKKKPVKDSRRSIYLYQAKP